MSGWRKGPPANSTKAPSRKKWSFWGRGGSAGKAPPSRPRVSLRGVVSPLNIIFLVVAALFLELNYQYYDYKGKMPLSPGRLIYKNLLPGPVASLLRGAGKVWGGVHGRTAVTLLPDHVMLCVPKSIEWENPAPDSPEAVYKADVENVVRNVAKRHAQPGMTFDENGFHYDGGGWIAYTDAKGPEVYRSGNRLNVPVDLREYWSVGWNFRCGNTEGHEDGPKHYRAYAYTFDGEAIPASE